jgi:probable F420-dependent oxidoreductase
MEWKSRVSYRKKVRAIVVAQDLPTSIGENGVVMQFGIALPHFGPAASPEAVIEVAQRAEALGFDSVWALDRLLWPLQPTSKYPGNPRGELPTVMQNTYDPLTVLTFVAAHTQKVRLGTSVLVASYRSPIVVAKMVATLDVLSAGRVILGVGAGWSTDEFIAVNQRITDRDEQTDEFLKVLHELWTTEEPCFEGKYYRVPRSVFLPKPRQIPRPPIWIGGNTKRALRRAAEFGDGWHPTNRLSPSHLAEAMKHLRALAQKAGRDPDAVALTLRWNALPSLTQRSNVGELIEKLHDYENAGVQHVCFDLNIPQPSPLPEMIKTMERLMHEVIPRL